jgi:hypothetical protein
MEWSSFTGGPEGCVKKALDRGISLHRGPVRGHGGEVRLGGGGGGGGEEEEEEEEEEEKEEEDEEEEMS